MLTPTQTQGQTSDPERVTTETAKRMNRQDAKVAKEEGKKKRDWDGRFRDGISGFLFFFLFLASWRLKKIRGLNDDGSCGVHLDASFLAKGVDACSFRNRCVATHPTSSSSRLPVEVGPARPEVHVTSIDQRVFRPSLPIRAPLVLEPINGGCRRARRLGSYEGLQRLGHVAAEDPPQMPPGKEHLRGLRPPQVQRNNPAGEVATYSSTSCSTAWSSIHWVPFRRGSVKASENRTFETLRFGCLGSWRIPFAN